MTYLRRIGLLQLLLLGHVAALLFGLGGLLIALPNPELWADSAFAVRVYNFGMTYAGSLHIILGAAAMLVFGLCYVGVGRTLTFFVLATTLSLSFELIGTGTGWPFGNYAYTSFLGYKVLDRVPFTIPLSWFYVGFACYLLASLAASRLGLRRAGVLAVLGGVWLLTVWDLVLDPAMAHESMPVKFWVWYETGPYFGMPVKNFVGWSVTGFAFMALSRLLWRGDPDPARIPVAFPLILYVANTIFAMALSLSVGLWQPVLFAALLGVLPAATAGLGRFRTGGGARLQPAAARPSAR
jgi:putative membrane protein